MSNAYRLRAPRHRVWAVLHDPRVLMRALPGCKELTQRSPGLYDFTLEISVLAFTQRASGTITFTDEAEPERTSLLIHGTTPKPFRARVDVRLAESEAGETVVTYRTDAPAATGFVGRMVEQMIDTFFKMVERAAARS